MNNNVSSFENRYNTKTHPTPHTTNLSCHSYDETSRFLSTLTRLLLPKVRQLQRNALGLIKNYKQIQPAMLMFINHCAILIQTKFRGYQQRKYYKLFLPVLNRFKELMRAILVGWRVRKVLKLKPIAKKINKIKEQQLKNNSRQVRILKRQLIDEISELMAKGRWVQLLQPRKERKDCLKTKIILRSALRICQKQQAPRERGSIISQPEKKQPKEVNNSVMVSGFPENQIPIKSAGFYKIPDAAEIQSSSNNKKVKADRKIVSHGKNKPNGKKIALELKTSQKSSKQKQGQAQRVGSDMHTKLLETNNNENVNACNLEITSVLLPTQEVQIKPQQVPKTTNKNINYLTETQKLKKDRKGIKVTLSSTANPQSQNNQSTNIKTLPIEPSPSQSALKDNLDEIISVYESAYSSKRAEISGRFKEMKRQQKFTN